MADERPIESFSQSNVLPESSESTVELKIKTLDSQMYSFHVDKNITVSMFKEKIASEVGVPVGQQRLIFRGKVLKDNHLLSEYHVENGDTLHLVARQVSEAQSSSGSSSGETNTNSNNSGQDANAAGARPRVAQHSVVLGTFGVGDQGEAGLPDISRIIGAVLSSIGVGGQTAMGTAGGVMPNLQFNIPGPAPQGNQTDGSQGNTGSQGQTGNQPNSRQAFPGQSMPQVVQIPMGTSIAVPTLNVPIPDSLNTLSVFMNRMEAALSQDGGFQPNQGSNNASGSPPIGSPSVELPSNTRGFPTPAALAIVLRHAERLFSGSAISSLSHIAERLEQEEDSTDVTVRSEIQTESMRAGLAMQHLGALLLELGRTMLTVRIGQSPAESFVNAGPAVYISPSGPNPIMVQPFPQQASSLFGASVAPPPLNAGAFGPVGVGAVPRHVNIHIHTAVGPRTTNGEANQGGVNGTGDPGQTRVLPRNITATAIPIRPTVVPVTGAVVQPSVVAPESSADLSTMVAEINSRIRSAANNMQNLNQGAAGQPGSSTGHNQPSMAGAVVQPSVVVPVTESSADWSAMVAEINSRIRSAANNMQNLNQGAAGQPGSSTGHNQPSMGDVIGVTSSPVSENVPVTESQTDIDVNDRTLSSAAGNVESSSGGQTKEKSVDDPPTSSSGGGDSVSGKAVPLGLGLGGLQPKRKSRLTRSQGKSSENLPIPDQTAESSSAAGRNALQSLASLSNKRNSTTLTSSTGQLTEGNPSGSHNAITQLDPANIMSQVMQSPALEGLLSGVSQQSGIGSPDVFRNMLGQLTQNPAMMNTVSQLAQQIDTQDLGSMFSGLGTGHSGGLDLSRMLQQMMPIVSQALGGGGMNAPQQQVPAVAREFQPSYSQRRPSIENPSDQRLQIQLQEVVQRIEHQDPPTEILRTVVDSSIRLFDGGNQTSGLAQELSSDEGLANEFMEMLRRDIAKRLQDESRDGEK